MKVPTKTTKLYAAGLFLLALAALVFVQAAFNLDPFFTPSSPNQSVLLVTLSAFIFLVLLIFGFVLLRNLVKVWAERKQQKPGSKFKTRLLVSLVSLTLIPAALLFAFAYGLVNRSIDKWFSVPVDKIFDATVDMTIEWRHDHESLARSILNHLGEEPPQDVDEVRRTFQLKAFMVLDENGQILRSAADPGVRQFDLPPLILNALGTDDSAFVEATPYWIGVRRVTGD